MTTETCVHHWMIEPHRKPTSNGKCKKCGEVAFFSNVHGLDVRHIDTGPSAVQFALLGYHTEHVGGE